MFKYFQRILGKSKRFIAGLLSVTATAIVIAGAPMAPAHAEVDVVINSYRGVEGQNILPQILTALGQTDGTMEYSGKENLTPQVGSLVYTDSNYYSGLYFTSFLPFDGSPELPAQSDLRIRLRNTVDGSTTWYSVAILLQDPMVPQVDTFQLPNGKCDFMLTNFDHNLSANAQLMSKDYYQRIEAYSAGDRGELLFTKTAPRKLRYYIGFTAYDYKLDSGYSINYLMWGTVNTKKCSSTVRFDYIK